jgi:hypothetical protein
VLTGVPELVEEVKFMAYPLLKESTNKIGNERRYFLWLSFH